VTAGALHATGQLALDRTGGTPRVTGRLVAETLPLPLPYPRSPDPLPVDALGGWDGSVFLQAGEVLVGASPVFENAAATVSLHDGVLRVEGLSAALGGGAAAGSLTFDTRAAPPSLSVTAKATGARIAGPLLDENVDLSGGVVDGSLSLTAAGHSFGTLLATLSGTLSMTVRDGVLLGVGFPDPLANLTDAAVTAALAGGKTAFDTLRATAAIDQGSITIADAAFTGSDGSARITGRIDLPAEAADLHIVERPAVPDPPDLGVRLTGPLDGLQHVPELAGVARWRAIREASSGRAANATPPDAPSPAPQVAGPARP
jgi:hypothetical protein